MTVPIDTGYVESRPRAASCTVKVKKRNGRGCRTRVSKQDERRLKSQYLSTFTDSTLVHLLTVP